MAETPSGVHTPNSFCPYTKQKSITHDLENWEQNEEIEKINEKLKEISCGHIQNFEKCNEDFKHFDNDADDFEIPDYDIHMCKAPFTDMAFDLREYSEVHKNCTHAKSKVNVLLMERIAIFRQKMPARCKKSMIETFDMLINKFLDLTSSDVKTFKIHKFDPFADAMLLIIANEINMPRNVFLECLSIETRLVPSKITEVKKYSCYKKLKNLSDRTLAKN